MELKDKFIHGLHEKQAVQYLKDIGIYDVLYKDLIDLMGETMANRMSNGAAAIIAANKEYNARIMFF